MKFDLNQIVFYIEDNKIHSAPILSRMCIENVFCNKDCCTPEQKESFQKLGVERIAYATIHGIYAENQLFASKEELFSSL